MNSNLYHSKISLNGYWNIYWCEIGKGNLYYAKENAKTPCMVPGDIHSTLIKEGYIKDPLLDDNSKDCTWVEQQEFWYVKTFEIPYDFNKDMIDITFEGLDLSADIWVNDQYIGSHNNAFYEKTFDVTKLDLSGENTIVVRIDQGLELVKEKPLEKMGEMWNNDQPYRVWMRKPQYVYGWDWTIWLATCGITNNVTVNGYKKAHLEEVYVYTDPNDFDMKEGQSTKLFVEAVVNKIVEDKYTLQIEVYKDARYDSAEAPVVLSKNIVSQEKIITELSINNTKLWWTNGIGDPYLYHFIISLYDKNGDLLDKVERNHGVRTVSIREDELGNEEKGFTFIINGQPIFCKGANHVPTDCLYGRVTNEKTRRIVEMAADCNMNMLRVWGGGIYESDVFMETCDELGLLVWHDFMFACGYYPDHDKEFYEEIEKEATAAIKRLRNHTSLIGWSGNNEIQEMYVSTKGRIPDLKWYGGTFYEELLPNLVNQYCRNVIYRESSPYGGKDSPADFEVGDQHVWHFTHRPNYEHYLDLWQFTEFNLKFLSEFGVIGAMSLESVQKCISKEYQDVDSEAWLHHSNTSSDHQMLNMVIEKYFGDYHDFTLQEYILKSQVIQAEITRHIYDEFRARKFVCSGLLFWTLGDSYGIHNWSLVDYYLEKKPVYYYLKRSMSPLAIAIRGYEVQNNTGIKGYKDYFRGNTEPMTLWVMNDLLSDELVQLEYTIETLEGKVIKKDGVDAMVAANSCKQLLFIDVKGLIEKPENTILYVWLRQDGKIVNENRYFFAPYKEILVKDCKVECSYKEVGDGEYEMELESDTFVWMLHLNALDGVLYSDNDFDLLPNRKKTLLVKTETSDDLNQAINCMNPVINCLNPLINVVMKKY